MSVDLCEDGFFARLTRDGEFVVIRLLERAPAEGAEPEVSAAFRCGPDELAAVLAGYTLQLSNERGDFLLASAEGSGVKISLSSGEQSKGCAVSRQAFENLLLGLNAKL